MIQMTERGLAFRCKSLGRTVESAVGAIAFREGDLIYLDEKHPDYPPIRRPGPPGGPGTELKALIEKFGFIASPKCKCAQHVAQMDRNGCQWCEENLEEIVGWLKEEAAKAGLPFLSSIARLLVKRAISNARAKIAKPA